MKSHKVRFTHEAEEDLVRLFDFLAKNDVHASDRALEVIEAAMQLLALSPYSCRKATWTAPVLRELVIPFASAGYVALFEIEAPARDGARSSPPLRGRLPVMGGASATVANPKGH